MADNNFSDSIEHNLELLTQTLQSLDMHEFTRAKFAAKQFEELFAKLRRDYPQDRGVASGATYAVMTLAQRLVEAGQKGAPISRIILPH